ncbi:hypothetical protein HY065_00230 [Candidatus Berkelbacteria bacterium]|nr:hypothetical protein [Candidatus Berkelbacteria bacterium]
MPHIIHKQILASELQDTIGSVLKEVEQGGVFYTVKRYKTPKMAIINLNDLTPLESFICEHCMAKQSYEHHKKHKNR